MEVSAWKRSTTCRVTPSRSTNSMLREPISMPASLIVTPVVPGTRVCVVCKRPEVLTCYNGKVKLVISVEPAGTIVFADSFCSCDTAVLPDFLSNAGNLPVRSHQLRNTGTSHGPDQLHTKPEPKISSDFVRKQHSGIFLFTA